MNRLLVLAFLVLAVAAVASAHGRGLQQGATASAVAVAGPGSTAVSNADATTDGTGDATSISEAVATDGSVAVSDVSTTAEDGASVTASVSTHASDGAYVKGKVDLKAEEGAVAVFGLVLGAGGNKTLAVEVWGEGFRTYDGNVIALTLWKAYQESPEVGAFATEACGQAFSNLIVEHSDDPTYYAPFIVSAVKRRGPAASYFGGVLIYVYEQQGCEFIRPACIAADEYATRKLQDKYFIKSIAESPELISCIYDESCDKDVKAQCCTDDVLEAGKCQCVDDVCNYKLFWEGDDLIWKCITKACELKSKCSCASSS